MKTFTIISIIILSFVIIWLFDRLLHYSFKLWKYKKYGPPPSTGMYYDAELGSINGEIDNRGKYICDDCGQRFKTPRELKVHLRRKKIDKISNGRI
jgi:hypothetical protein